MTSRENQEYNPLLRGQFLCTIIPYCLGEFYPWVISSSILMTCMLHYNNRFSPFSLIYFNRCKVNASQVTPYRQEKVDQMNTNVNNKMLAKFHKD